MKTETKKEEAVFKVFDGLRVVYGPPGTGKAQPVDTPVLTPRGYEEIGSLRCGSRVIGADGQARLVTGVFDRGNLPVYRVTFSDGTSTRACGDHLWLTARRSRRSSSRKRWGLETTRSILKTLKASDGASNHSIPVMEPADFSPEEELPMDPYALGLLLGDGFLTSGRLMFSNPSQELQEALLASVGKGHRSVPRVPGGIDYDIRPLKRWARSPLSTALYSLGLMEKRSHEKFIPKPFLLASREDRIAMLQGLMDTDGYCSPNGHLEFSTSSRALCDGFVFLVQSLGGTARISVKERPRYTYLGETRYGRTSYRIAPCLPPDILPFRCSRKGARYKPHTKYFPRRIIRDVSPDGEAHCVCISVDSDDGLYITNDCIVTHNTTWLFSKAEEAARRYGPLGVLVTSMTRAAAAEVRGRTGSGLGSVLQEDRVGTLHSWAIKALGYEIGEHVEKHIDEWNKEYPRFRLSKGLFSRGSDRPSPDKLTFGDKTFAAYSLVRARLSDPVLSVRGYPVREFSEKWTTWKELNGFSDYDDWIERAYLEDTEPPGRPAVIYVDEAQDHSPMELRLLALWGKKAGGLVCLGDPDQAIMSFRGADPTIFLAVPEDHKRTLEQSYRVPAAVHRYAQAWIRKIKEREDLIYHPREEEGAVEEIPLTFRRTDEKALVKRALVHREAGESCLFLAPCSGDLLPLLRELRAQGVPFHNPYATTRGDWNPMRGLGRALAFLATDTEIFGQHAHVWTWREVWRWAQGVSARHLVDGTKTELESFAKDSRMRDLPIADSIDDAVDSLSRMFEPERSDWYGRLDVLRSLYLGKQQGKLDYPTRMVGAFGKEALTREPSVAVGTIHSVKGGESDHVYVCPDLGGFFESDREDLVRLFYVAFTRAKKALYLCAPSSKRSVEW